jgi:hypothetical protein
MDLCFAILTLTCAIFSVQIFMQSTRQTQALRPQLRRLEEDTKGQDSEKDKYHQMADEAKGRIAILESQIKELEGVQSRHEKALQARLSKDGEQPQNRPSENESGT